MKQTKEKGFWKFFIDWHIENKTLLGKIAKRIKDKRKK